MSCPLTTMDSLAQMQGPQKWSQLSCAVVSSLSPKACKQTWVPICPGVRGSSGQGSETHTCLSQSQPSLISKDNAHLILKRINLNRDSIFRVKTKSLYWNFILK